MDSSPLVVGLAAVFAGMTVLLLVLAAVFRDVVVAFMVLPFAAATYLFWYHASGRIREGIHERARRQRAQREAQEGRGGRERGGFGAGPRFGGDARTRAERRARTGQQTRAGGRTAQGQRVDPNATHRPTRREAYRTLGLEQGADEAAVKRAYREKVKDAHPDRGGDEEAFKEITRAYERLTE